MSALSLEQARACIGRGLAKARELGFEVAIAVVDEGGHLVACDRMDGALWVTPEIARAKANAAAGFRASTQRNVASPSGSRIVSSSLSVTSSPPLRTSSRVTSGS